MFWLNARKSIVNEMVLVLFIHGPMKQSKPQRSTPRALKDNNDNEFFCQKSKTRTADH